MKPGDSPADKDFKPVLELIKSAAMVYHRLDPLHVNPPGVCLFQHYLPQLGNGSKSRSDQ